jgi:DNA mismatch repair ATPase MutS
MAAVGLERELEFPELVEDEDFLLEAGGVYHLLLDEPVANPVAVRPGDNLVFLTGPNMSGKTTYLKSVAISVFLAHLGMGVPAENMRITPFDALYSSLSPEESLRAGLSFFMAEVERVREVAESLVSGKRALVLFDELFRGTNVKDAIEASRIVVLGFCNAQGSGFVISSHLLELADELRDTPSIKFMCLDGQIRNGEAEYGYHLRPGISDRRFGLTLLDREGVPTLLDSLGSGGQA